MSQSSIDSRFEGLVPMASGAMGSIYKGWDRQTGQLVAVKVPSLGQVHRFWREARLLSQMDHPNIVAYVDSGLGGDGLPWLAMEWLEGEDLETKLLRGPLPLAETLAIGEAVASALAWAHARGVMHRDLKPSNLLTLRGDPYKIKILDFGLARSTVGEGLTATGMFIGTAEYIAPEQAGDAKRANARSDVYSFGAVLFHCLTGVAPFGDGAPRSGGWIPNVGTLRCDVPVALADLVARMLSRSPADRPADGAEVKDMLANLARDTRDDWEAATQVMTKSDIYPRTDHTAEWPWVEPSSERGPSGTIVMPLQHALRKR